MRQPYPKVRLGSHTHGLADVVVHAQQRDQRHLKRHHQHAHHQNKQPAPTGKLHPAEGISGERGDQNRNEGGRDGDLEGVEKSLAHTFRIDHLLVVGGGEGRRCFGHKEDAQAAVFFVGMAEFQAVAAVCGHTQCAVRFAVFIAEHLSIGQLNGLANSEFTRVC